MSRNAFILSCLIVAATASGCGKKGPPRPPEPRSPRAPETVAARQIGTEIRVWFTVPQARGDRPSQVLTRAQLLRVDYAPGFSPPPDFDAFRRRGEPVGALSESSLPAGGERADVGDGDLSSLAAGGVGATLRYAVQLFDARGRPSPLTAAIDLVPSELATAPEGLTAEATGDGIRLVWTPPVVATPPEIPPKDATPPSEVDPVTPDVEDAPGEAAAEDEDTVAGDEQPRVKFNVYRGPPGGPAPEYPINPVPLTDNEYLDTDPVEGERYRYVVRRLLADGAPLRESASSTPVVVLAQDLIAPAPPTGLVAVQEGQSVRLFWNPNSERDVAGYRVYRRLGRGPWAAIGPAIVEQMSYNDRDVRVGQVVAYRVTAVDRATPTNESAPSEMTELDIVAEPSATGTDPGAGR